MASEYEYRYSMDWRNHKIIGAGNNLEGIPEDELHSLNLRREAATNTKPWFLPDSPPPSPPNKGESHFLLVPYSCTSTCILGSRHLAHRRHPLYRYPQAPSQVLPKLLVVPAPPSLSLCDERDDLHARLAPACLQRTTHTTQGPSLIHTYPCHAALAASHTHILSHASPFLPPLIPEPSIPRSVATSFLTFVTFLSLLQANSYPTILCPKHYCCNR